MRIAAEDMLGLKGRRVTAAYGNARIDLSRINGRIMLDVFSRGKQLLLDFGDLHIRVHFMMYGSYRVNQERPNQTPRLALDFEGSGVRFYNCSVRLLDSTARDGDRTYDPEIDITGSLWNPGKVLSLVRREGPRAICDVLMDQEVFAGVGNMIKNEALFRARIHPLSRTDRIPIDKISELLRHTREFSLELYEVERKQEDISQIFEIYRSKRCRVCGGRVSVSKRLYA